MHRLLQRQIKKLLPEGWAEQPDVKEFLEAIEQAYVDYDHNHEQIERTLELSSSELFKMNQQLNESNSSLEAKVEKRTQELELLNKELLNAQQFARIGSFEIDFQSGFSSFTEQSAALLNLSKEELQFDAELVKRLRKSVFRDDLAKIDKAWMEAMEKREEVSIDFRIQRGPNEISHLNWKVRTEFNEKGSLSRVTGTLQDITERVQLEERTRLASLIVENSPTILIRWRIEEGWPVDYVSSNIRQFGYDIKEFINKNVKYVDIILEEDRERIRIESDNYKNLGETLYTQTYRIRTKNGEIRWVEDRTQVEEDIHGEAIYHQGLITDITERIKAEEALQNSEKRFRSLVHNSSDITTILSAEGTMLYESASFYRIFGYSQEKIIGQSAFDFIHPEDLPPVLETFQSLIANPAEQPPVSFRFRNEDGHWIYLEAIGNNQLGDGSIEGIVVNSRDVTERIMQEKQMQEYAQTLEKINKELDQFAYIVSHDLKAPLRAINNLSIWIEEDLEQVIQGDTKRNFELLRGRIHRMESLINGILQYSRAGRMKSENQPIDTQIFVQDILHNLAPPEHFKIHVAEDLPVVSSEKIALDQVLSNFISNAIKYNDNPNPEIHITYKDLGDAHQFCIGDNGSGIEPEFHEKIFMIFQTLQARDKVESTGVGLAIVKKIVEEKGGRVWIDSAKGQGARFYFTLPKL